MPAREIEQKLDTDFFAGRWARTTDRQRDLMFVIAHLENCDDEFTVQEIVEKSREVPGKPFGSSHTNQILAALSSQGLVFKNRQWEVLVRCSAPGSLHPPATIERIGTRRGPVAHVHHFLRPQGRHIYHWGGQHYALTMGPERAERMGRGGERATARRPVLHLLRRPGDAPRPATHGRGGRTDIERAGARRGGADRGGGHPSGR